MQHMCAEHQVYTQHVHQYVFTVVVLQSTAYMYVLRIQVKCKEYMHEQLQYTCSMKYTHQHIHICAHL
jgi:hypothetical protein